jgi:hypothetical protein
MATQKKEDFEFVKEKHDNKKNYIFKKNTITKTGFYITAIILVFLVVATIYYGLQTVD